MVANIRGYTPNYGLKLINFDTPRWHTLEYSNWELVDAIMASTGLPGLRGEWINSTTYIAGERVFDAADGKIYGCLVTHTSAPTGTFAADRAAHPTYWLLATLDTPRYRGTWQASVAYSVADIIVINAYTYYICIANHTSSATFPPDAPKWSLVFDATAAVNTTNANATAAAGSATQAATSATNAATSATNAATSATDSAAQAQKLFGTSTSSVIVGLGGKTFITQSGKYFNVGKFIMVRADVDPVNQWMWGQVTSYAGTSLVINAITSGGSGTYAAWTIDVSGSRGATGPQGPQGELGPPLIIKGTVPTAGSLPLSGNTIGDMYIATDNSHLYIWDGTQWDDAGPLGTSTTTTADVPPSNPKDGDMWWESDTGIFWVYYDDGNTSQWVQAGGAAASINQNFVLKTGDTMTGHLTLPIGPTATDAVRKDYVDAASALKVAKAGDTMAGALIISATTASTSPTTGALTVAGGLGVGGAVFAQQLYGTSDSGGYQLILDRPAVPRKYGLAIRADNALAVDDLTAGASRLTVGATGTVGVVGNAAIAGATASTSPSTGALTVAGGIGVGGALSVGSHTGIGVLPGSSPGWTNTQVGVSIWSDGRMYVSNAGGGVSFNANAAGVNVYWNCGGGSGVGNVSVTGSSTSYNTTSDARLKEDLKSFDAGNIIDDTEVYDFKWKDTSERAFGVLAQQAKEVYATPFFHDEKEDRHFVDYSKYVPVLLQELKALRARVAELEGKTIGTPSPPKRGRR